MGNVQSSQIKLLILSLFMLDFQKARPLELTGHRSFLLLHLTRQDSDSMQRRLLQYLACGGGHHGVRRWGVLALEVVAHLLHGDPFDTFMFVDVLDDSVDVSI
jgi:hypothetical protein